MDSVKSHSVHLGSMSPIPFGSAPLVMRLRSAGRGGTPRSDHLDTRLDLREVAPRVRRDVPGRVCHVCRCFLAKWPFLMLVDGQALEFPVLI